MIHVPVEQNTEAWFTEKLGKPSASNADKIVQMDGKPSKQREGYLNELAAEIITGRRYEGYQNGEMMIGNERQEESKKLYEIMHDCEVTPGGVCFPDEKKRLICSPDGLVMPGGEAANWDRGLEMKNPMPKTQVKYLRDNVLPSEYFSQVQFSLLVTGFERWDFMSYCPGLPPLVVNVSRDEKFLAALKGELERFCTELDEIVRKIS
jgi:hypothetical protein